MVASVESTYADKTTKTSTEVYQCWKDGGLTNFADAGLKGMKCHVFAAVYTDTNKAVLDYRMYSMKVPGTALIPATQDLKSDKAGSYLFYTDTDNNTKKGFKNDKVFTNIYAA